MSDETQVVVNENPVGPVAATPSMVAYSWFTLARQTGVPNKDDKNACEEKYFTLEKVIEFLSIFIETIILDSDKGAKFSKTILDFSESLFKETDQGILNKKITRNVASQLDFLCGEMYGTECQKRYRAIYEGVPSLLEGLKIGEREDLIPIKKLIAYMRECVVIFLSQYLKKDQISTRQKETMILKIQTVLGNRLQAQDSFDTRAILNYPPVRLEAQWVDPFALLDLIRLTGLCIKVDPDDEEE